VVEIERHLFPGKQIITLSPAAHIKRNTTIHTKTILGEEQDTGAASSSSNTATEKMVKKEVPMLTDY
jgi:hypothetical protein